MTNPEVGMLMLGLFIFVILLGFPIAFTLIAMAIFFGYFAMGPRLFDLLVTNTADVMQNDVLTAVPLFLFMGYIVERANIVSRLFSTLAIAARNVPGSLGVAALITCTLFATATGIVGAVVTLMGLLALPAMLKARYDHSFASGIICAGGTLGILIPPSITLILYGIATETSIGRLFLAGVLPGLLLTALFIAWTLFYLWRKGARSYPPEFRFSWREKFSAIPKVAPFLAIVIGVLYVLYGGIATPSEAAGVGAALCVILAIAIYRMWNPQQWWEILRSTTRESVMILMIIATSVLFSYMLSSLYVAQALAENNQLEAAAANLARYDGVRYGVRKVGAEGDLRALYRATRGEGFGAEVRRRILIGTFVLSAGYSDQYYARAQSARHRIAGDFSAVFQGGVDLLFTPTTPTPAFAAGEKLTDPVQMYLADVFVAPASLAGLPAMSIPIGRDDGLPLGGQLIAPRGGERDMIATAMTLEASIDGTGEVR